MGEQCDHTIFGNLKTIKPKLVRDPAVEGTRDDQKRGSRDRGGGSGDISLLAQSSADEKKGAPPRPDQMGTTHI